MKDSVTNSKPRLWNLNFILLWQGQLVSEIGDIIYDISLSFFVLAKTGSTLMMSYVLAATILPRILLSPIAGIIADKSNKKLIIVLSDFIRGVAILFIGILGLLGLLEIWMLLLAGIIIGVGGAFFQPTVNAILPDIAHKSKLMAANAAFSLIQAVASVSGYFAGGVLYTWVGAYILFLANGVSYLISAISELFIKIKVNDSKPTIKQVTHKQNLGLELKNLLKYIWSNAGLRYSLISNAILNFFTFLGVTLILPFFEAKKEWGSLYYGITMGFYTLGTILGLLLLTKFQIPKESRAKSYILSCVLFSFFLAPTPFIPYFGLLLLQVFLAGLCSAFAIVIERNALMTSLPSDKRAQVFGVWSTISDSLVPLGIISAGFLAHFFGINTLISFVFAVLAIIMLFFSMRPEFMEFLNSNEIDN